MLYRIEVNINNIGKELETPGCLNPTRTQISASQAQWQLLSSFVDESLASGRPLLKVCNGYVEQNPYIGLILPGIWEVIFERVRPASILFRRTECAFFFTNIQDALNFKAYPGMEDAVLCEVEIIKEEHSMKADMRWLDNIDEKTATAADAMDALSEYWTGKMTAQPVEEILFTGKFKLNPVK